MGPTEAFLGAPLSTIGPFTATTTSANAPITGLESGGSVRINASAACRVSFGRDAAAAATTPAPGAQVGATYTAPTLGSKAVAAGIEVLTAPAGTKYVAFKTDSGTAAIEFTPGIGVH